jgi:uncharacterized protein (DUF433 family)
VRSYCHTFVACSCQEYHDADDTEHQRIIVRDNDILGGLPVFSATRVPVQTLLDYLEGGQPLDEFPDDFPTVRREQAIQLLEGLKRVLLSIP